MEWVSSLAEAVLQGMPLDACTGMVQWIDHIAMEKRHRGCPQPPSLP